MQFLQVGRLYRALILLRLALYLRSASVSSVFMVLCMYMCFFCNILYVLARWAWRDRPWRDWLITVVQCYDTVGWVIWPVEVPEMTYNVSSGTLNPTIRHTVGPLGYFRSITYLLPRAQKNLQCVSKKRTAKINMTTSPIHNIY